jgi:hypothetical protein
LIYRSELFPNIRQTIDIWREEALKSGIGEIYLIRVESFSLVENLKDLGFDAALNFSPNSDYGNKLKFSNMNKYFLGHSYLQDGNAIFSYDDYVNYYSAQKYDSYKRYRCVMVSFDNSPRRKIGATVFIGSSPDKYYNFLKTMIDDTVLDNNLDQNMVFINAWNEWGEGNYLEPDLLWGRGYLESTVRALNGASGK